MSYSQPLTLLAGSVITESGYGAPVLVGRNRDLAVSLDVAEVADAGTLDVDVETAPSAKATRWRKLGSFSQASAAGSSSLSISGAEAWVRARYKISAGAEIAAGVSGVARLVLRASALASASGTSTPIDVAQFRALRLALEVTAGTGTLAVNVQTAQKSDAGVWTTVGTFATATGAGEKLKTVGDLQKWVRLSWTLTGMSGMTFSVSGTAHLVYAAPADRTRFGVRGGAIPDASDAEKITEAAIITAPSLSMYLQRWELPLREWDETILEAHIAALDVELLRSRGAEPGDQGAQLYVDRYKDWFGEPPHRLGKMDLVAAGKLTPHVVDSAIPETATGKIGRSVVASRPPRGFAELLRGCR